MLVGKPVLGHRLAVALGLAGKPVLEHRLAVALGLVDDKALVLVDKPVQVVPRIEAVVLADKLDGEQPQPDKGGE